MNLLAFFRSRPWLLIAIVGGALMIFILEAFLQSSSFFFRDAVDEVGQIDGETIRHKQFNAMVVQNLAAQERNMQGRGMNDFMTDMVVQQTWNGLIKEKVFGKEYEKLGLIVSGEELYDRIVEHPHPDIVQQITDPQTGQVVEQYRDPVTGQVSTAKMRELLQKMDEASLVGLENGLKEVLMADKYFNLIKKAMYVTNSQAKMDHISQNKTYNVRFVAKKYSTIADSTVKVNDDDLRNYYNAHLNDFKNEFEKRKINFVTYDINATAEDINNLKSDLSKIAGDFKSLTAEEDSSFVISEAETKNFQREFTKKGVLKPEIDTLFFAKDVAVGSVYGPYEEAGTLKVTKLLKTGMRADSAKCRHILLGFAKDAQPDVKKKVYAKADSIKKLINKNNFADLAKQFSEDPGSKDKGGVYDWFKENKMVKPFQEACFQGKKGELVIVQTEFGYHIIEVLEKGKEYPIVFTATIDRKIIPSAKTEQEVYSKVTTFASKLKNPDSFQAVVAEEKLTAQERELQENNNSVPGFEKSKELVRWAYNAKKGDYSAPLQFGYKFVVAQLTEVKEKGILPLEVVKAEVEVKARQDKKAEQFIQQLSAAGTSLDAVAGKENLAIEKADNLNFSNPFLPGGAGKEDAVVGSIAALKENTLSKPLKGTGGVYVATVDKVNEATELKDIAAAKKNTSNSMQYRVTNEVLEALKEKANVKDNKAKFDFGR